MLAAMITPVIVLLIMGLIFGIVLGIADKVLKVEMDPRLETLISMLPGYNCGACGSPGCEGHANAVFDHTAPLKGCKPMKAEQEAAIRAYLKDAVGPNGEKFDVSKI